MTKITNSALEGIRVLDLSGAMGNYCGKLFADMGADVILVEPPQGTELRFTPPFLDDAIGPDASLAHAYNNTGKRSITLDLNAPAGQASLRELVSSAQVLIETGKPGDMAQRGLAYDTLSAIRPDLVYVSITSFGQTGPYAQYAAEDIVALAMGGMLYLGGYPDTAPIRVHGDQALSCAGVYGAVAALLAVLDAEATGKGQHVDVSMQECVVLGLENAVQFYDLEGTVRRRTAGEHRFAGTGVFPCRDGHVYLMAGGIGANKFWGRTLKWFAEEGMVGVARMQGPEWSDLDFLKSAEAKQIFNGVFAPWAMTRSKAELYHAGQKRQIPIAPVNSPADILGSEQLASRQYFADVPHGPDGATLRMPGAPYKLGATPWRIQRPAPSLGQHNKDILGELCPATAADGALERRAA